LVPFQVVQRLQVVPPLQGRVWVGLVAVGAVQPPS